MRGLNPAAPLLFAALLPALLMGACGPEEIVEDTGPFLDTGAVQTAPLPDPSWDAGQVSLSIDDALALGLPDPGALLLEFQGMWTGADDDCPTTRGDYSMTLIVTTCIADSGYRYGGVSTYEPEDDGGFWLLGDGFIDDDQDRTFSLAGELELVLEDDTWESRLTGIWGYPGSPVGWIAEVPGLALWATGAGEEMSLGGSYGLGDTDLFFEDVVLADSCVTGAIWLRDPQGSWYTLTLAETCDGCGSVSYGDEELGEACVNIHGALLDLAHRME